jgi:type I restriction enzyme S subunit
MKMKNLPKGWEIKKLGEITNNFDGKRKPLSRSIRSERKGEYRYYGATEIVDYIDDYLFDGEYLLIGEDGANLLSKNRDLAFIVKGKFWVNNHAHVLNTKDLCDIKYLEYYFNSLNINEYVTGTAQPKLNQVNLNKIPVYLPSLETQQRIVTKIEELFSELDKGVEELKKTQEQLKTYRQSVLKWAFEGRFTNENVKDGELPNGWELKTLKELTSLLGDGLHGTPKYDENGDCFFINGNNLVDGKIEIKHNTKRISHEEFLKYRKQLNSNTVLVSINGTLGNVAFYNDEKVALGKSACYFNLTSEISKYYVKYIIQSQRFINYAINSATGSTIPNVSLKSMREFEIPTPPIEEQRQIVQEIESRLSVADKLEEQIKTSLQQAEALRQSILKKAFEGELVR